MRPRRIIAIVASIVALLAFAGGTIYAMPSLMQLIADRTVAAINHGTKTAAPASSIVDTNGGLTADGSTIPVNAADGISIGNGQNTSVITPLNIDSKQAGIVRSGMMIYRSNANANDGAILTNDGAQFLKVIENAKADEEFSYRVDTPEGGKIVQASADPSETNDTGTAMLILDANGQVTGSIATPWAHDWDGTAVPTYFTLEGNIVTQHVLHRSGTFTYPIVADPYFRKYSLGVVVTMTYNDMVAIAGGGILTAQAIAGGGALTGIGALPAAGVAAMVTTVASGASWGVATHNCFWFWIPWPGVWDTPGHGYYKCR